MSNFPYPINPLSPKINYTLRPLKDNISSQNETIIIRHSYNRQTSGFTPFNTRNSFNTRIPSRNSAIITNSANSANSSIFDNSLVKPDEVMRVSDFELRSQQREELRQKAFSLSVDRVHQRQCVSEFYRREKPLYSRKSETPKTPENIMSLPIRNDIEKNAREKPYLINDKKCKLLQHTARISEASTRASKGSRGTN